MCHYQLCHMQASIMPLLQHCKQISSWSTHFYTSMKKTSVHKLLFESLCTPRIPWSPEQNGTQCRSQHYILVFKCAPQSVEPERRKRLRESIMFSHNYNLWAISSVTEGLQITSAPINRLYNLKIKHRSQNLREARPATTIPIKDNLHRIIL